MTRALYCCSPILSHDRIFEGALFSLFLSMNDEEAYIVLILPRPASTSLLPTTTTRYYLRGQSWPQEAANRRATDGSEFTLHGKRLVRDNYWNIESQFCVVNNYFCIFSPHFAFKKICYNSNYFLNDHTRYNYNIHSTS